MTKLFQAIEEYVDTRTMTIETLGFIGGCIVLAVLAALLGYDVGYKKGYDVGGKEAINEVIDDLDIIERDTNSL